MNLTPLDIRRHQFAKAFRGYEPTEVDTFLKQVSDQLESMQEEVRRAEERVREAEAKLTHYEKVELALQEALESARETARRAETSAEAKAKLILEEAELKAERLVHDAERERYGLRQDLAKLNSRQAEVAARLRGFLLSELEILAQFQGDDPVGFIKLQSAGAPGGTLPPPRAQLSAGDDWEDSPAPAAPETAPPERTASEAPILEPETGPEMPTESLDDIKADNDRQSAPHTLSSSTPLPPEPVAEDPEPEAAPEPEREPWTTPPVEPPASGASTPDDAPSPEEPASPPTESAPEPDEVAHKPPPAVTGGWDLRSLVTGEERSVAASEAERERIRRILDDLD